MANYSLIAQCAIPLGYTIYSEPPEPILTGQINYKIAGQKHWLEFHTQQNPTQEWFDSWVERIPNYGCMCKPNARKKIAEHPPRFNDWFMYGWEFHNIINNGVGNPQFSLQDAKAMWKPELLEWKSVEGLKIGFVVNSYEEIGGTETFHQTLIPRLNNIVGFVCVNTLRGNREILGVPTASGLGAINSLVEYCEIIVSWGVDWTGLNRPKHLVTVHHGSLPDTESTKSVLQGDSIVCVNKDVANLLKTLTKNPVTYIQNAVDPNRLKPLRNISVDKKICLWSHRFHEHKQPKLAMKIAECLPDNWHMVMTGKKDNEKYESNDRVTILPPEKVPGDWLSVADCFLSTSIYEGFGLSVAEAIVAGVPVVSTPVGIAPGFAITVDKDASPKEWADTIVVAGSKQHQPRPDLFSIEPFIEAWKDVIYEQASTFDKEEILCSVNI